MSSSRGKDKYNGPYPDLQAVMAATDARGYWIDRGPHKIFRSKDGVVVRWCATTKTIVFQGRYDATDKLRTQLSLLAGDTHPYRGTWCDDDDYFAMLNRWPRHFSPDPAND